MKTIFRYQSNVTESWIPMILHIKRHFTDTINTTVITWSGNATIGRKNISYHVTSVANNVVNPFIFVMSIMHDKLSWYTKSNLIKKDLAFAWTRNSKVHFHWDRDEIMPWYYVMILGVIYSFYFGPWVILLYDHVIQKSVKISTAYDVWFSRYRPSNIKLAIVSAGTSVHKLFVGGIDGHGVDQLNVASVGCRDYHSVSPNLPLYLHLICTWIWVYGIWIRILRCRK